VTGEERIGAYVDRRIWPEIFFSSAQADDLLSLVILFLGVRERDAGRLASTMAYGWISPLQISREQSQLRLEGHSGSGFGDVSWAKLICTFSLD
jgi:hypothetical protein